MKFIENIFGFLHSKTKSTHFKVRSLNVYFKNSINPTQKLINLDRYDLLEFKVEQVKREQETVYEIIMVNTDLDSSYILPLASFESKKDADLALLELRNSLYGKSKTFLWGSTLVFIGVAYIVIYWNLLLWFKVFIPGTNSTIPQNAAVTQELSKYTNPIGNGLTPVNPMGNISPEQMNQINELQKKLIEQTKLSQANLTNNSNTDLAQVQADAKVQVQENQSDGDAMLKKLSGK
jgi:hypothetical protein